MSHKEHKDSYKDIWVTEGVFSSHYLLERLLKADSICHTPDEEILSVYNYIRELHKKNVVGLKKGNEANTERRFIDKVFDKLGFGYLNQDRIPEADRRQVPDYFLYATASDADKAFGLPISEKYKLSITIAEAKRWDHNLNQPSSGKGKVPKGRYPHQQIRDYLNESEHIRWGILTNGKEWRLYLKNGRSSRFFEINFEKCLEDLEVFKYFYILFNPTAFIKDASGKCFLDNVLEESLRFHEDVEKDLREKVFKCVELLGQGFLSREENSLTGNDLRSIYTHSLILLYRILFLLNAEARGLLSTNPQSNYYKHYGIQRIKDQARHERGGFLSSKTTLYGDLLSLFDLINGSNEKLNRELGVPRYNGGLFDPERYSFLITKKIGDDVISEVIYELSYREDKNGEIYSLDYKGLGERHLGTIYEGLLEYKFSLIGSQVALKNDKGERKSTGAYYTPDYIVKYIVENTLGPILKEIDERLKAKQHGNDKDDSFAMELLKLNICDPAIGSGHFLVEALQYLAEEIAYHPTTQLKTSKGEAENEVNYWKRRIVESCIYGVDIKELAVELAKLSIWLKTVDRSQPLSFLDHHLRCGNSLIGARIEHLSYLPLHKLKKKNIDGKGKQLELFNKTRFKEDITTIIKGYKAIEEMSSEKFADIKAKEKAFHKLLEESNRYKEIANLYISFFFGNKLEFDNNTLREIAPEFTQMDLFYDDKIYTVEKEKDADITNWRYRKIVLALQSPEANSLLPKLKPLLESSEAIAKEKQFFHWELEFPEVFFNEDGSPKTNPGFDCVIGNPPYINVEEIADEDRDFLMKTGFYITAIKRMDIFVPFHELSIRILKNKGIHSFIVPFPLLTQDYAQELRVFFLDNTIAKSIIDLSRFKVFPDAVIKNIIPIFEKQKMNTDYTIKVVHQNKDPNISQEISGIAISIDASQFRDTYKNMFRVDLTHELHEIQKKMDQKSIKFGSIFAASWGARGVPVEDFHLDSPINKYCKKMIKGGDIERYEVSYSGKWLLYDIEKLYRPSMPEFFENPKILFQEVTGRHGLMGVLDKEKFYTDHSLICCIPKYCFESYEEKKLHKHKIYVNANDITLSKDYDILYILSVMNSRANGFYFTKFIGYDLNVYPENIEYLPIPKISFNASMKERNKITNEAIKLFNNLQYDAIIRWTEDELSRNRSDTIHDLLAFLAEQMIALNKKKHDETKGFLKWLEREIGIDINEITGKTTLKNYYAQKLDTIIETLKANKKKLSINPQNRKFQEILEENFYASMSLLDPLKNKINTTDNLIDQIVYKLYGLTDEEIIIVERSEKMIEQEAAT